MAKLRRPEVLKCRPGPGSAPTATLIVDVLGDNIGVAIDCEVITWTVHLSPSSARAVADKLNTCADFIDEQKGKD